MSTEVPTSNMIVMTLMPELESLFGPLFDEYLNGENQVVLKSSAVTTVDASVKRQQQPDSISSTSTLATSVTANENFDLFSPNKTFAVYEKTPPRSDLRWKPTGRIFKSVGLRWIHTGKLFDSCTSKVDSEPPHGSNVDIPNTHECKQTLAVSAGTSQSMVAAKPISLKHCQSDAQLDDT
ncbi:hypothetical protein Tco_0359364 [Tanacetum coccineum]